MTISGSKITTTPARSRKASGPISIGASTDAEGTPPAVWEAPSRWTLRAAMPV